MDCLFSTPINLGTEEVPDWEFSEIACEEASTTEIYQLITNSEYPDRKFFIDKSFSYGDVLIVWFLTIFLIIFISKIIFNFFWKK